ncbi:MAG TPA: class II aldolase/adducin family protein [Allosphingosinicella sp.]|nr:class II aldolase/adducin family protein [Allosphingosinicella sp.]
MASNPAGKRSAAIPDVEWAHRVDLAAFYRIVAHMRWDEIIFSHITLRLPGPERHFLINPFGMLYEEITASSLVKIDIEGNVIDDTPWPINKAGFVIHSALHEAREDAHCVAHVHTTAGMAVAQQAAGLLSTNFYSASLYDKISYHDFEGSVVTPGEKVRLAQNLGSNNILILRNHGLLVCGPDVATTFSTLFTLQRACETQIAAQACGSPLIDVPRDIREAHRDALNQTILDEPANDFSRVERLAFEAMVRRIERIDSSFRN